MAGHRLFTQIDKRRAETLRGAEGNALFLILIAVALFAALSYAVTRAGRGNPTGISQERMRLEIAQIESFAALIQTALLRMSLAGIPDWQVDYSGASSSATANASCTSNACKLFHPEGGGAPTYTLPAEYQGNNAANNHITTFWNVTVMGAGQPLQRDLIMRYTDVARDFCIAWNRYAGVINNGAGGAPPTDTHSNQHIVYTGNIAGPINLTDAAVRYNASNINGQHSFCFTENGMDRISIVLINR